MQFKDLLLSDTDFSTTISRKSKATYTRKVRLILCICVKLLTGFPDQITDDTKFDAPLLKKHKKFVSNDSTGSFFKNWQKSPKTTEKTKN